MAGDLHLVASGSRLPKPGAGSSASRAGSGRVMVMGIQQERTDRIDALRGLIERLCAPDLTLAEATVLRARLPDLLEPDEEPRHAISWPRRRPSSLPVGGATGHGMPSSCPRPRCGRLADVAPLLRCVQDVVEAAASSTSFGRLDDPSDR